VPMGYKFSWSPRGVLTAVTRPSRFFANKEWHSVDGPSLYRMAQQLRGYKGLDLYWIPNGDSEKYANCFNLISPELDTCVRGTLRYSGFTPVALAFVSLKLLDQVTTIESCHWTRIGSSRGRICFVA